MDNPELKLKIKVFSDYICPFCYIGKVLVEKIEKDYPEIEIDWKMIEIHPELPKNGIKSNSFSSPYLDAVWKNVKNMAYDLQINIKIPEILANSKIATIASEFAKLKGRFKDFHEQLMDEYWINGKNISEINVILDIWTKMGLNEIELKEFIYKGNGEELIKKNLEESYDHIITGVPSFVINDKVVIGAQPFHLIKKVIEREILSLNESNFTPI